VPSKFSTAEPQITRYCPSARENKVDGLKLVEIHNEPGSDRWPKRR